MTNYKNLDQYQAQLFFNVFPTVPKNGSKNCPKIKIKRKKNKQIVIPTWRRTLYKDKCSKTKIKINKLAFVGTWGWTLSKNWLVLKACIFVFHQTFGAQNLTFASENCRKQPLSWIFFKA